MSDLENNLEFTWHLVSQFVSWEFCRYMGEEKENPPSETDVLIFLRNMIVERTEKVVSDITKHEIVAKLIMELKSAHSISRMSCIELLAASVTAIFPKLKTAVNKLVDKLKTFSSALQTIAEERQEIIHVRIQDTINDFIKEANRLLSPPLLLQIVKPWKPKKKVYDHDIFENVLKCLCNDDPITRSEAKLIALSLKEDKVFEKILLQLESKHESDSVQFSVSHLSSQTSENIYSQEFIKNSQGKNKRLDEIGYLSDDDFEACKFKAGPSNLQSPNNVDPDSFNLDTSPPVSGNHSNAPNNGPLNLQPPSNLDPDSFDLDLCPPEPGNHSTAPDNLEFQSNFQPPPLLPADSPTFDSPPEYPFIHRNNPSEVEEENIHGLGGFRDSLSSLRNAPSGLMDDHGGLRKSPSGPREAPVNSRLNDISNHVHFTQPSANKSPPDKANSILDDTVSIKFKEIYENQKFHKVLSDSDTSDCEKTEVIRFLTPTLFKKGTKKKANKVVYLSDVESNNSSIISVALDSQKNDPNWTMRELNRAKMRRKNNNQKKSVQQLDVDSSSSDDNINLPSTSAAFQRKNNRQKKAVRQLEDSSSPDDNINMPSTSAAFQRKNNGQRKALRQLEDLSSLEDNINVPSTSAAFQRKNNGQKKAVRQLEDSSSSDDNINMPSTSAMCYTKDTTNKRRRIQLVSSSPSGQDFVAPVRRPTPGPSNQVPLHKGTNTKSTRKHSAKSTRTSKKTHKCKDCSKIYKTDIALRRHIFLKHTSTTFADNSDFEE